MGEYQPRTPDGTPDGPPVSNYYPPAVTEAEFHAARVGAAARRNVPGSVNREGKHVNIFAGMVTNWTGTDAYFAATRTHGPKHVRALMNVSAADGRAPSTSFPYVSFERAILSQLAELVPADVVGRPDNTVADTTRAELAAVQDRIDALSAEIEKAEPAAIPMLTAVARRLTARETDLRSKLSDAEADAAVPPEESFVTVVTLTGLLDTATDPIDVRVRLRSALRRVVSGIRVVFLPAGGRDRLAFVRVGFVNGGCRVYGVLHTPPHDNGKVRKPGRWWCRSHPADGFELGGPIVDDPRFVPPADFVARFRTYATGTNGDWRCPACGRTAEPAATQTVCWACDNHATLVPVVPPNVTTGEIP